MMLKKEKQHKQEIEKSRAKQGEREKQEKLAAALSLFGLAGADCRPVRHNENAVYEISTNGARYALRIHASAAGFEPLALSSATDFEQRAAEAELLLLLRSGGFAVPEPCPGRDGAFVQSLPGGTLATLLTWLPGDSFDALWPEGDAAPEAAFAAGKTAGRLDAHTARFAPRFLQSRPRYGEEILPSVERQLRRAHSAGVLADEQLEALVRALGAMGPRMREAEDGTGLAVCHADLTAGNLIWHDGEAAPIDFSLAGAASPYMDLANLLANFTRPAVRRALLAGFEAGYGKRARLRLAEPYYALSIILFIAQKYPDAASWDWFPAALARWDRECFSPLAANEPFLAVP